VNTLPEMPTATTTATATDFRARQAVAKSYRLDTYFGFYKGL